MLVCTYNVFIHTKLFLQIEEHFKNKFQTYNFENVVTIEHIALMMNDIFIHYTKSKCDMHNNFIFSNIMFANKLI